MRRGMSRLHSRCTYPACRLLKSSALHGCCDAAALAYGNGVPSIVEVVVNQIALTHNQLLSDCKLCAETA
jgi:hypothetical protein